MTNKICNPEEGSTRQRVNTHQYASGFNVPSHVSRKLLLASSCLSVCVLVRMRQLGSPWTDFLEFVYVSFVSALDGLTVIRHFPSLSKFCAQCPAFASPYKYTRMSFVLFSLLRTYECSSRLTACRNCAGTT